LKAFLISKDNYPTLRFSQLHFLIVSKTPISTILENVAEGKAKDGEASSEEASSARTAPPDPLLQLIGLQLEQARQAASVARYSEFL
jgi:hypothetical protein